MIRTKTRVCNTCKKEFPLTSEYFQLKKSNKEGFDPKCKLCENKYKTQYHKEHRDKANESMVHYRKTHMESCHEYSKQYYKDHIESKAAYSKRHMEENREYYTEHYSQWRKENKEKCNIRCQRYRTRKRQLPCALTTEQWEKIKQDFDNKCCYCDKELPLAQEHFLALNKGGEYTTNNIIPSCRSCNSSKGTQNFFIWYPKQSYYSKEREQKILKYLNYKDNLQQLKII